MRIAFLLALLVLPACTFVGGECNDCKAEVEVPCFVTHIDGIEVTVCPETDAGMKD